MKDASMSVEDASRVASLDLNAVAKALTLRDICFYFINRDGVQVQVGFKAQG